MTSEWQRQEDGEEFLDMSDEVEKLGPSAQDILNLLAEDEFTTEEIARLLGLSTSTMLHYLEGLERLGLIEEVGG
jgi:predicted transcriptional regulator